MLDKVHQDRLRKLQQIRELGIDPYGGRYDSAEAIGAILGRFKAGDATQRADAAGRVILLRDMGKMMFAHLRDETGQMQIALRKSKTGQPDNSLSDADWTLAGLLDLADLVAVEGPLVRTRTGEVTIFAERLTLLCKSLLPMPEKFHGLTDVEIRYRQRYLDLMANPESMAVFKKRIAIIDCFRERLRVRGFVEVETPMMQAMYGGAAARPFVTHHNTLDADLFLRISPELYLKRLLVGGMGKVFEINRNFRNEGLDTRHNPEFTMMELYQACADYEVMMEITEELIATAAERAVTTSEIAAQLASVLSASKNAAQDLKYATRQTEVHLRIISRATEEPQGDVLKVAVNVAEGLKALGDFIVANLGEGKARASALLNATQLRAKGRNALPYGDRVIDYTRPWARAKYADLIAEHAGVDWKDSGAVRAKAQALGIEESNKADAVVVNELFERLVEPALAKMDRPVFVMDYPAELCPLTRRKADDPSIALRFECYIAGMEIANAYTELNDPAVQEANFSAQLAGEAEGETMRVMDEDFLTALRHGMPPAGGLGIGIDRVVMLLTDRQSIRDVVLFPTLRPQAGAEKPAEAE